MNIFILNLYYLSTFNTTPVATVIALPIAQLMLLIVVYNNC